MPAHAHHLPQPDELIEEIAEIAAERKPSVFRRIAWMAGAVALIGAFALLWFATPLRHWIDVAHLVEVMNRFGDSPLAPVVLLCAYAIGALVLLPLNILIAVTVIVFGPLLGAIYAVIGSMISAVIVYEIGCRIEAGKLHWRLSRPLEQLGARIGRRGLAAVLLVRIVPVAPYSVVNLVAGAARIRRRDYLLGTALGLLPSITLNALFVDRVIAAIEHPNPLTYALLALATALIVGLIIGVRRRMARVAP